MKTKTILIWVLSILFLVGCAPGVTATPVGVGSTPTTPTSLPPTAVPSDTPAPVVASPTPVPTHIAVDLTPAQRAAIQALSEKNNIPVDQIKLVSTEAVTWPSGCLGVVLPGVMCTQNQVDGFRILLSANGEHFEYHTNQDGASVLNAAQQLATVRLVVSNSDHTIALVEPQLGLGPTYSPAFTGFLPYGGATNGYAYVLDFSTQSKAVSINENGSQDLAFIQNPNYGLAIWRGDANAQPKLAWGTQPTAADASSSLMVSNLDGSNPQTLLVMPVDASQPMQLLAEFWSADGQSLYYSQEPYGIGGYIPFGGASSLYKIDLASKQVTELIPMAASSGPMTCLDALSGDYMLVADHCTEKVLTIRDLTSAKTTTINPPDGLTGIRLLGSARFSPDGKRVAFAMAKGDPSGEQGWVAVSDGLSGASKLLLTGQPGSYYTVAGWLNDDTLLVQSNGLVCNPNCANELWSVGIDGSAPVKIADGSFLTVMDNR